jgi:heme-degrading monooxygenase HmoA
MILEIAKFEIKAGQEADFEAGYAKAVPLFERARGYRSVELRRSVEAPAFYWLIVGWETLENHTVDFRESEDFQTWRTLVGSFFANTPLVEHAAPLAG